MLIMYAQENKLAAALCTLLAIGPSVLPLPAQELNTRPAAARPSEHAALDASLPMLADGLSRLATRQHARDRKPSTEFDGSPLFSSLRATGTGSPERKLAATDGGAAATTAEDALDMGSADEFAEALTELGSGPVSYAAGAEPNFLAEWRAQIASPREGSTLSTSQTFTWTSGTNAQTYWLWVGSCQDCTDLYDGNLGLRRQETVGVPSDGRRIFVTLFTLLNGEWWWYDYQYAAPNRTGARAEMLRPAAGSTLGSSETFSWSRGENVDHYWLWIGSCQNCTDILDESMGTSTSRTVGLPLDGRVIHVTLFSLINGDWYWHDYQFRAGSVTAGSATLVVTNHLLYPVNLLVNGRAVGSVPPGETRETVQSSSSLSLSWELVRPTVAGRAIGDTIGGRYSTIDRPSGRYTFTVDNRVGDSAFFVPSITNRSAVALLIEANGGLQSENRCNCTAPANTENVIAGYYRLFNNSSLRLYRSGTNYTGRYLIWSNFASRVEEATGRYRVLTTTAP